MSLANKMNKGRSTIRESISLDGIDYVKAKDIAFEGGDPIKIVGFLTRKSELNDGRTCTLITENKKGVIMGINIPDRYAKDFDELSDEEVEDLKAGKLGIESIKILPPKKKGQHETAVLNFIDL